MSPFCPFVYEAKPSTRSVHENISPTATVVGEDGFSSAKPQCCSFVTPWIYRPRTPIAVSLSAGSGVIVSGHSPSSALLAASEELRDDDITLSGAANEFSGVDHRPLSGPYGHQKHADESERCRCGKAKASPAVCTLCARCVHPWHG